MLCHNFPVTDLLSFDETESESDLNWWIHDVPDHLPSPSIKPEPIKSENDNTVGDLISLADDGIESGGGSGEGRNEWYEYLYYKIKLFFSLHLYGYVNLSGPPPTVWNHNSYFVDMKAML